MGDGIQVGLRLFLGVKSVIVSSNSSYLPEIPCSRVDINDDDPRMVS